MLRPTVRPFDTGRAGNDRELSEEMGTVGIVVFLIVCCLVAYAAAGGWSRAHGLPGRLARPLRHPAAGSAPTGAAFASTDAAPAEAERTVNPVMPGLAPELEAPPALADLEFPIPAP